MDADLHTLATALSDVDLKIGISLQSGRRRFHSTDPWAQYPESAALDDLPLATAA